MIFLDNNATTQMAPEVVSAIHNACVTCWANPSSKYGRGQAAKLELEAARLKIARLVDAVGTGAIEELITFTSGGTEANHTIMRWAIKAFFDQNKEIPHVITSNIEHVATELPLRKWAEQGKIDVTFVEVDKSTGMTDVKQVKDAIKRNTCLVSIMAANNETGVIQPIKEIAKMLEVVNEQRLKQGLLRILLHTDAAQVFGKIPFSIKEIPVDYITIVGHKFYGPRIGAIYHKIGAPTQAPLFYGGGQEYGRRSGTENVPMAVGLGVAADLVTSGQHESFEKLGYLRDLLIDSLKNLIGGENVKVNFEASPRLPNTASLSFRGITDPDKLLVGVEASRSAACHSVSGPTCSSILIKSGLNIEDATSTLRLSIGRYNKKEEILSAADSLAKAYKASV